MSITNLFSDTLLGEWHRMSLAAGGLGDFIYYTLIYKFTQDEIRLIGPSITRHFMGFISGIALVLMTVWVMLQGFRIVSGESKDSLMGFVMKVARNALIISVATTMTLAGKDLQTFLVGDLDQVAVMMITGEKDTHASDLIERNLLAAQLMLTSIDAVEVSEEGKLGLASQKTRTMWIAGFGALGPAVTGGAMLLMYEIAMALFVGFGPLFILALIFDSTKQLFWKWLYYGIGTLFSMAVLALMTTLALKVIAVVVATFWLSALGSGVAGTNLTQGMSSLALQQGGIGLLLTMLLISVPPIASNFFQGALGNFFSQSQFGQGQGQVSTSGQQPLMVGQHMQRQSALAGSNAGGHSYTSSSNTQSQGQQATLPYSDGSSGTRQEGSSAIGSGQRGQASSDAKQGLAGNGTISLDNTMIDPGKRPPGQEPAA